MAARASGFAATGCALNVMKPRLDKLYKRFDYSKLQKAGIQNQRCFAKWEDECWNVCRFQN